ncbi:hypothetical protein [Candidatus Halocynthiibacter alkanivorans]|uniref:hypothetical protein n=1 Tax=Candidatus Halocynthiibacter alkanivorans TaxID=2267619 RepID=UPI000DF3C762|nr:hypothetical protein [Candidatus Halocynthiibacter alkanivorans]
MSFDLFDAFEDCIDSYVGQCEAYKEAITASGGVLSFETAVKIAEQRLIRVIPKDSAKAEPKIDLPSVLMELSEFIPTTSEWDAASIDRLITASKTSFWAWRALEHLELLFPYVKLHPPLKKWQSRNALGILQRPRRPTGLAPAENLHRNTLIIKEIEHLRTAGFQPMRNSASINAASGCDVVVKALSSLRMNLSYKTIEKIWTNRPDTPFLKRLYPGLVAS